MHIDWAVTCRYAESDSVVATIVGAGVDLQRVQEIPGPVGTMLAVRLAAAPDELGPDQMHKLTVQVLDPSGDPVRDQEGDVTPPLEAEFGSEQPVQQAVPGWLVNPLFTFGVQWWVIEPGTYSITLRVDDGDAHLSPMHVLPVA
jgi:hypothetical protein